MINLVPSVTIQSYDNIVDYVPHHVIPSPWLIHFMTGSLYLLSPHLFHPLPTPYIVSLVSNFLNMWNMMTVITSHLCLWITSSVLFVVSINWVICLLITRCVFLLFCIPGNFWLAGRHCVFFLVGTWIVCTPKNILELFPGTELCYFETIWNIQADSKLC